MASAKRSVAIVGAGPAGLVTASTLFRTQKFDITIFEKTSEVGGLWSPKGLIDQEMTTNLCQFTVAFAGLSWDSVNLGSRGGTAPIYPQAWQVSKYLEEYYRRYIPKDTVQFNTTVTAAELQSGDASGPDQRKWRITTATSEESKEARIESLHFDHLVVASGPFSRPLDASSFAVGDLLQKPPVPILHSTQFKKLADLIPTSNVPLAQESKILVIGGSHSGSEIATKIASELSSLTAASGKPQPVVYHVSSRNLFALSPLLRTGDKDLAFEPADFKLYNRSNVPAEPPPSFTYGLFDVERQHGVTKLMRDLTGVDPDPEDNENEQMQLSAVISKSYTQLTAFGAIKPIHGNLLRLDISPENKSLTATIHFHSKRESQLENVVGVVYATGFDAAASVSFLADDIKSQLDYDPSNTQYPLVLDTSYLSQNMNVQSLAVVGFATQYWGVMEMQARALAEAWANNNFLPAPEERKKISEYHSTLRATMKAHDVTALPPYPFGDYVGLVEQAARELHLKRIDGKWSNTEGPICPARYVDTNAEDQQAEAVKTITKLQGLYQSTSASPAFTAAAVFYGLLGKWVVDPDGESGDRSTNRRDVIFRPHLTADTSVCSEYLVTEATESGSVHKIFRHEEGKQYIEVWSTASDDLLSALQCKSKLIFENQGVEGAAAGTVVASVQHVDDAWAASEMPFSKIYFNFTGTRITRYEGVFLTNDPSVIWIPRGGDE